MAAPLSLALRLRVAGALAEGSTVRSVAKRFGISVSSAVWIGQRQRAGRGQMPGRIGGHRRQVLAGEAGSWLLARLAEKPDLTMRALSTAFDGITVVLWRDAPDCFHMDAWNSFAAHAAHLLALGCRELAADAA